LFTAEERASIVDVWRRVETEVARFLPARDFDVRLSPAEHDALVKRLEALDPMLARSVAALRHERTSLRLSRLAEQAKALAARLGRAPLAVAVEDNGARVEAETFGAFWANLVHGVRNAVDHGIERPEERARAGKPPEGRLRLATLIEGTTLELVLEDDGRGVDWAAVRSRAEDLGLPAATRDDLVEALFHDRFTTRTTATETSGRGVGMHAMREAAIALGGVVTLSSEEGRGTRLVFRLPIGDEVSSIVRLRTSATPSAAATRHTG
jgi:two-component system chemotaxis sensor kinase CheA